MPDEFVSYDYPNGASHHEKSVVKRLLTVVEEKYPNEEKAIALQAVELIEQLIKSRNRYRAFDAEWDEQTGN